MKSNPVITWTLLAILNGSICEASEQSGGSNNVTSIQSMVLPSGAPSTREAGTASDWAASATTTAMPGASPTLAALPRQTGGPVDIKALLASGALKNLNPFDFIPNVPPPKRRPKSLPDDGRSTTNYEQPFGETADGEIIYVNSAGERYIISEDGEVIIISSNERERKKKGEEDGEIGNNEMNVNAQKGTYYHINSSEYPSSHGALSFILIGLLLFT